MIHKFAPIIRAFFVSVLSALALSACAGGRGGPISYDGPQMAAPDPLGAAMLSEDYQLAPGDKLKIDIFRVADLSGEHTVDLSGRIAMPLVGSVDVLGMTSEQLASMLEKRLSERYLRNPKVTVGIVESNGRLITVDGSVKEPGAYPVTARTTLVSAIAMAKGMDDYSNPRRVAIFRQIDGKRMAAAFDVNDIRKGLMEDPRVYPGDVVVVDGSTTRKVLREVLTALPVLALFKPY